MISSREDRRLTHTVDFCRCSACEPGMRFESVLSSGNWQVSRGVWLRGQGGQVGRDLQEDVGHHVRPLRTGDGQP